MGTKRSSKTPAPSRRRNRRLAQLKRLKKLKLALGNGESHDVSQTSATTVASSTSEGVSINTLVTSQEVEIESSGLEKQTLSSADGVSKALPQTSPTATTCSTSAESIPVNTLQTTECHLEGRRVVAIDSFLEQMLSSKDHGSCGCNITDMFVLKENRMGLQSIITLKCKMCSILLHLTTDYPEGSELNVNNAAALGAISSGIGYSTSYEYMSVLNVPFMSPKTFAISENNVAEAIHDKLWKQIEENGIEEARLARLHGYVDSEGIPNVTVIADGAWSKRSYNINYNALSGVACIIGYRTRKLLFLAIRNKYCCICARAQNKHVQPANHKCFKNFFGPSTAMESAIIVEGFKKSIDMHNIKYTKLIGDGDSSITKTLVETRPYGATMVEKIECSNHLLRNFSKHLREVTTRKRSNSKNLPVSPQLRKIVSARMYRLVAAVKKAVEYRSKCDGNISQQISGLLEDMKNAPSHVFGEHKQCKEITYFNCQPDEGEINYVNSMSDCGLFDDIETCFKRLIENAYSLILNMTNNLAEQYNSIVCKFVGGKRINYTQKQSYQTRCEAAALSFNSDGDYHRLVHKQLVHKSPRGALTKYIESRKKRMLYYARNKGNKKQLFKKTTIAMPDEHYGTDSTQIRADLSIEDYEKKAKQFMSELKKSTDDIARIEKETRGQAGNPLWFQERSNRITASNFKKICSMKKSTSCIKTVTTLLYGSFTGNSKTRYSRRNEMRAINDFQKQFHLTVEPSGLIIDTDNCMLGASPDGFIGEDAVIEVKCPANAANLTPIDAIKQKVVKCAEINEDGTLHLKRNHEYFYQVQGQLNISKRNLCYFVIWTPQGLLVENIQKDEEFWRNEMVGKLRNFYNKCLLPEIIDPRKCRGMEIRNPPRE